MQTNRRYYEVFGYMKIGLDIGSTTLKCVVTDDMGGILHSEYERHYSLVASKTAEMLTRVRARYGGGRELTLAVSGSAGMGVAEAAGLPFVQEVYATRLAVKKFIPDADVVIELGGEDAKILFLGQNNEVRMNGSCAGGTGAFIDQMATLLSVPPDRMNELAREKTKIYTIASRCGVFAKSDIQPLINQGAKLGDVSASIFYAVVNQTVSGLAQGRELTGKIIYLGGPLTFLSELRAAFDDTLNCRGVCPQNSLYYVALGAALSPSEGGKMSLDEVIDKIEHFKSSSDYGGCPPLFSDREEYDIFCRRHAAETVKEISYPKDAEITASLGIDAGSTTVKAVAADENGDIIFTRYEKNAGNPINIVRGFITEFYETYPNAKITASAATGYGEELVKNAFGLDFGIVETIAHLTAAKRFKPNVDFIIDIGGQDIKCFKIRNGVVDNIFLNEACSSGCGSFLQTFAEALGYTVEEFAKAGIFADKPVDLGSRCTVFMNSSVKQAQKDGATVQNISAGLSISVVKNALYKVIRAASAAELGENIVVQGGTFLNDAVLRAFELELDTDVVRPGIAGLMGAYGAALWAANRSGKLKESSTVTAKDLQNFKFKTSEVTCRGCENNCRLTVSNFEGGRRFISGNRCEKPLPAAKKEESGTLNMYTFKRRLLDGYINQAPPASPRGKIGIPLGLNMYEMLPFWHAFFTSLGFEIITSPYSDRELYLSGQHTIPSDTVCFPAKLLHGHIEYLLGCGTWTQNDAIFYPCMSYNFDEKLGDNHYNCPVVAYYPEVIAANVGDIKKVTYIYDYIGPHRRADFTKKIQAILSKYFNGITKADIAAACEAAYTEYAAFLAKINECGIDYINRARQQHMPVIVLAGRPYHLDPETNHAIDEIICGMGAAVITEETLSQEVESFGKSVLDQWTYHSRLYAAAKYVAKLGASDINFVQLVSFGCGVDAVTTDEAREILESNGKIYTQIKIDEITNPGAVKIRLRSLFAALEQESQEGLPCTAE